MTGISIKVVYNNTMLLVLISVVSISSAVSSTTTTTATTTTKAHLPVLFGLVSSVFVKKLLFELLLMTVLYSWFKRARLIPYLQKEKKREGKRFQITVHFLHKNNKIKLIDKKMNHRK